MRLGSVLTERNDNTTAEQTLPLSVTKSGIVEQQAHVAKSQHGAPKKRVERGDLVINSRSDRKGSAGLAHRAGSVSLINIVLQPVGIQPQFAYHLLRSTAFQEEFFRHGSGIVDDLWTTRYSAMKSIQLPIPPQEEQRAIADYLDYETAEIDAFIADLRQMTHLSQEEWRARRDSALSIGQGDQQTTTVTNTWFSERAAHWQEGPLKFLFDVTLGKMLDEGRHVAGDAHYPYVRAGDIGDGRLNLENLNRMPFDAREQRRFAIDAGDLLVVEGGSVGTNVVLDRPLDGIYFQKTVNRMRSKADAVPGFYSEVLNAYRESGVLDTICNRSTIMHLTADKLGGLVVPVPPVDEQRSIATHLRATRSRVEELEEECKRATHLANERRAALISAAVTGQLDVSQRHRPVAEVLEEEVLQNA